VATGVQEHVGKSIPDFSRISEHMNVTAIRQHPASSMKDAVHGPGKPRCDGLHSAREISRAGGLDDQVNVIALDGVMHEPEPAALADFPPSPLQLPHQLSRAQRGKTSLDLQRNMTRMPRR
jgi:hypothetical protein